jgi:hypothetical protein
MPHVPGPWRCVHDDELGVWAVKSAPCTINGCFMKDGYTLGVYAFEEDARLIAAAPEMMEIIEKILQLKASDRGSLEVELDLELFLAETKS